MTLTASSHSVPGGTRIVGALGRGQLLLQTGVDLSVFDLPSGAIRARRTIAGLTYATIHGSWIAVHDASGPSLLRADLAGDLVRWPEADKLTLAGVVGSIAVLSNWSERMRFDLAARVVLDRVPNDAEWQGAHERAGLLLGVRERAREIVALRPSDGAIAWTAKPFAAKVDSLGRPQARRDEVHVRASVLDDALVACIGAHDGIVRGVRPAASGLDTWLPDLGADVDERALAYARRSVTYALEHDDAIVIPQEDQVLVVRAAGVARVATPAGASFRLAGDALAAIVQDNTHVELVVVPLPVTGDHDLVIEPVGGAAEPTASVPAVVTFAGTSAPIVIVQHPQYGRVNLLRDLESPPPPVGAQVFLDGVEVTPGGSARVDRWWLAGVRAPREKRVLSLGPPAMAERDRTGEEPTRFVDSLRERAGAEGLPIRDDVLRFLAVVDRDPKLRRALGDLGFHFDEDELGLDILPELDIEGFVPIWGNGYGDGYGGLTNEGVAFLWTKDDRTPRPIGSFARHVREKADEADQEAAADLVRTVLDRESLA